MNNRIGSFLAYSIPDEDWQSPVENTVIIISQFKIHCYCQLNNAAHNKSVGLIYVLLLPTLIFVEPGNELVQEIRTVTFEIQRDVVEEQLDEWMQVCTSCEELVQAPWCLLVW